MLVSSVKMLRDAEAEGYVVGQFNVNNLEWIRAIFEAAEESRAPVILGVTENAGAYMGGLRTVREMVAGMAAWLKIGVPAALHLDHASFESCLEAIGAGFTSVMFDGSKMPFAENMRLCCALAKICKERGVALEAELGAPAGEEDGITGDGERARPEECAEIATTGVTSLAASVGNIHGEYPAGWSGLDFVLLKKIKAKVGALPLVLHGGSGVPEEQIKKAIGLGICKINVNTECQIAFAKGLSAYFEEGRHRESKGYNLQKLLKPGLAAIKELVREKIIFFGSRRKA